MFGRKSGMLAAITAVAIAAGSGTMAASTAVAGSGQRMSERATGHEDGDPELTDRILALDSAFFAAFNAQDLDGVMAFFTEDLEFYHDTGGLTTLPQVRAGSQQLFARDNGLNRVLVPGTTEVYPVPGFGAIQIGKHQFCHVEDGRNDCGTFGFTHVWRNDDGRWRVARVLSYDH